jgi:hypothetical protein
LHNQKEKENKTMERTICTYNEIINNIKVRLYNAEAEINGIKRDAKDYGFDGLVLVPVIDFGETEQGFATAKITKEMINFWGVTEDEVFAKGIENLDYTIRTMRETMIELMRRDGTPEELIEMLCPPDPLGLTIISNPDGFYGAASAIPATKELAKRFPNGYVILPSSVHEVIVLPYEEGNEEELNTMVEQVNASVLAPEDKLSDDIYVFVA